MKPRKSWAPPKVSDDEKRRLARQVEELGAKAVARQMRPWDMRMLLVGGCVFLVGVALLGAIAHRYAVAVGVVLIVWGLALVPLTIYREVRDVTRCTDWLASIQKYYGRDGEKYGN